MMLPAAFLAALLLPLMQDVPAYPVQPSTCLSARDAERINKTRSAFERAELFTRFGKREMADLSYYVDPYFRAISKKTPSRTFDEVLSATGCVWESLLKELQAWKPGGSQARAKLGKLHRKVRSIRQAFCFSVEAGVPPYYEYYTRRAKPACQLLEDIEAKMENLTEEVSADTGQAPSCLPGEDAKRIARAGSTLERLSLYTTMGSREVNQLLEYLSPVGYPWDEIPPLPRESPRRSFAETASVCDCIWEEMLKELGAWRPSEPKPELGLRAIYREVVRNQMWLCYAVKEEGPACFALYRLRAKSCCDLLEDVETRLRGILATAAPAVSPTAAGSTN